MATFQPHVGDVGTILRIAAKTVLPGATAQTPVDLSSATNLQIVLLSPQKRRLVKAAQLTSSGTDGKFQYSVDEGDLDVPGRWRMQGTFDVGPDSFSTEVVAFFVAKNI